VRPRVGLDHTTALMKSGALSAVARLTPSSMAVCRVAPDMGLSRGGDSHISHPEACGHRDENCGQPRRSFHVANDTDFGSAKEQLRLPVARRITCATWQEAAEMWFA
jgi:hypothetical protein